MRAIEEDRQLVRLDIAEDLIQLALEFGVVLGLLGFGFGLGEFEQHLGVLELLLGLEERLEAATDRVGLVNQLLRLLAVVPESVAGHLGVEFAEATLHGWNVKETSASASVSRRRRASGR